MKTLKKYLIGIKNERGSRLYIGVQTDSLKPIYIYHDCSDMGYRYVNIGSAANILKSFAREWEKRNIKTEYIYGTAADLPVYGCSEWNKALFKHYYCCSDFPSLNLL